jgi:dihydroorotate dehydrogenase (fumarate)
MNFNINNIYFKNPLLNASGCWVLNENQIKKLYSSQLGGIVLKTCTLKSHIGNKVINYTKRDSIHFNCKGLPNYGYNYYKKIIKENEIDKPIILSVAYTFIYELKYILSDYNESDITNKIIEINLSCPNKDSRIPGYHKKDILIILELIRFLKLNNLTIGLKLPPYFELEFIYKLSEMFNKYSDIIHFITVSNSIPNSLLIENNKPVMSNVYSGISGKFNKYISLSNVYTFNKYLDKKIKIIGCGGIENIRDINDYLNNGATLIQLSSCFYNEKINELDILKINNLDINKIKSKL